MKEDQSKLLFERLLKVDTEAEVVQILKDAKLWDDPAASGGSARCAIAGRRPRL